MLGRLSRSKLSRSLLSWGLLTGGLWKPRPVTLKPLTLSTSTISEGAALGAVVGAVQGQTSGSTLTLTDDAGGLLALVDGYIEVAGALDYETATSHEITLRETLADASNTPRDTTLTIEVTNVLEVTLTALSLSAASLQEGAAEDTVVGTVQGLSSGSTWTLTDDAGGRFKKTGNSIVAGATATDYEAATSHDITIREANSDGSNSPRETTLTISVSNVAEVTLGALSLSASTISEGASNGTVIGQVQGASAGSSLSLVDDAGGLFSLSGGYLYKAGTLDYETATSHTVTIRETHPDAAAPNDTDLTVTVTNVLEVTLAALSLSASTIEEGAAAGTTVGALQGTSTGSTLSLVDDAGGRFALSGSNIVAGLVETDYAAAQSHDITVRETHADGANSPRDTVLTIAVTEAAGAATNATHGSVTFPFDGSYIIGNFLDGPAYAVVPSGNAIADWPTPAETTDGSGFIINGAQINPTQTNDQGYDQRGYAWNAARKATFPASVSAGDIIVKSVGLASVADARHGVTEEYAVCYILSEAPPANSFSPAAVGWTGRGTPASSVIDISAGVASLLSYPTDYTLPTYEDIMSMMPFSPIFAQAGNYVSFYQELFPYAWNPGDNNYGGALKSVIHAASLALISDSFTTAQKEAIATRLVSLGKQWWDSFNGNGNFPAQNGGHFQFHLAPVALYLEWSGQSAELANFLTVMGGNFKQAFQITATQAAYFAPHDDVTLPYTWRRRNLDAINGNTFTVSTYRVFPNGDSAQPGFGPNKNNGTGGLLLTNGTTTVTVTAEITDQVANSAAGQFDLTVDSNAGFSADDAIWFVPPSGGTSVEDEYDWVIANPDRINTYNPNPAADYRNINQWAGQVLFLKAAGIWHSSWDAISGYVIRANETSNPISGWDYPTHNDTSYPAFDQEFWDDHAATIMALSPGASTPNAFPTDYWERSAGPTAGSITFAVTDLPSDGGSAITDLQYSTDSGTTWASLGGATTGNYTVNQHSDGETGTLAAATSYNTMIRAVNAEGPGGAGVVKPVTTGAGASPTINETLWSGDYLNLQTEGVPPTAAAWTIAFRGRVKTLAANTYLVANNFDQYVRIDNTDGDIRVRFEDSAGAEVAFAASLFGGAGLSDEDVFSGLFTVDSTGSYSFQVDGAVLASGAVSPNNGSIVAPLMINANTAGGAGATDLGVIAVYIKPDYDPNWGRFFDGSGNPTAAMLAGDPIGGVAKSFSESGDKDAWNARTGMSGTVIDA